MKKFNLLILSLVLLITLFIGPFYSFAQGNDADFEAGKSLVPCGNDVTSISTDIKTHKEVGGEVINPCGISHLFILINNLLEFILIYLVLPIATVILMYAGFKLLFSGGDTHARSEAKSMFWNVVKGVVFIAGAWLIVNTLLNILGYTGSTLLK
jgi:hypothetical protein